MGNRTQRRTESTRRGKAVKRPSRARVFGKPSSRQNLVGVRRAFAAYRHQPLRVPVFVGALIVMLATAIASRTGGNIIATAITSAAVLLAVHTVIKHPATARTAAVLAVWAPLTPYIASTYAVGGAGDVEAIFLAVAATGLLIALTAHRTSRGRPWLTVALALLAFSFVGTLLLLPFPSAGLMNGYIPTALVLAARGGGIAWVVDAYERTRERFTNRKPGTKVAVPGSVPEQAARYGRDTTGETRTAALLADLPRGYTIFHNIAVPGSKNRLHHLVIGPCGVFVLASYALNGIVEERARVGLVHRDEPLANEFGKLLLLRNRVAAELGMRVQSVAAAIVIHDAKLPRPRLRVAMNADNGKEVGVITVLAPDELISEVNSGIEVLPGRRVTRLIRRARLRFTAFPGEGIALNPAPAPDVPTATELVILDTDGNAVRFSDDEDAAVPARVGGNDYPQVRFGQQVSLLTEAAVIPGARIAGMPYETEDGDVLVPCCTEQAWADAQRKNKPPVAYPYPLSAIVVD